VSDVKQIKTIHNRIDEAQSFDAAVNTALAEGWELTKRDFVATYCMLYAELERGDLPKAKRDCGNCAHYDKELYMDPCKQCEDGNKWRLINV
jgi:hypothetical protein